MLELDGHDVPGIHYILSGEGRLHIAGAETVPLKPHTLQIVPLGHSMKLDVPPNQAGVVPTIVPGREHKQVVDSKQLAPTHSVADFCVCYQDFYRGRFSGRRNRSGVTTARRHALRRGDRSCAGCTQLLVKYARPFQHGVNHEP